MPIRPLPENVRWPLRLYRALGPVLGVLLLPQLLLRLHRRGGWLPHFGQRFGFFSEAQKALLSAQRWTWIHSISVGETMLALKLVRALRQRQPNLPIVLSVTTSTGFACALNAAEDHLVVLYNPVDLTPVVRRILDLIRPERLLFIEGELWPVLVSEAWQRAIPIALVNARLSPRSASRFARFKNWCSPFFQLLHWISVPDPEEIPRWESLGFPRERLRLTGSIKFDHDSLDSSKTEALKKLLHSVGVADTDPILLAGSTHDGEELILTRIFQIARQKHPTLRLILVPRHVERCPEIANSIAAPQLRTQQRSHIDPSQPLDILLVNVTGELRHWYELATIVFVGKSLTAEGGQNPVEPALAGKPVVFGPHMENFELIVKHLLAAEGARQVRDESELQTTCLEWLAHPETRREMGLRAQAALQSHQGAANRNADLILAESD